MHASAWPKRDLLEVHALLAYILRAGIIGQEVDTCGHGLCNISALLQRCSLLSHALKVCSVLFISF